MDKTQTLGVSRQLPQKRNREIGRRGRGKEGTRERETGERKRVGERRKEEREGRGSPLHRDKERGDGIIFHRHYFSLLHVEERHEKGGAGEGKERREGGFSSRLSSRQNFHRERESEGKREEKRKRGRLFLPPLLATEFPSRKRERGRRDRKEGLRIPPRNENFHCEREKNGEREVEAFPPASPRDGISVVRERARGREGEIKGESEGGEISPSSCYARARAGEQGGESAEGRKIEGKRGGISSSLERRRKKNGGEERKKERKKGRARERETKRERQRERETERDGEREREREEEEEKEKREREE